MFDDSWSRYWKKKINVSEKDIIEVANEESSKRFSFIREKIFEKYKRFEGLNVIEIGSGTGTNAVVFAGFGSEITLLDNDKEALKRAKSFCKNNEVKAKFVLKDAFEYCPQESFDVTMSFGLAEHYLMPERAIIIKKHYDLLDDDGISFISVPNKKNIFYWMTRAYCTIFQGFNIKEYAFTYKELENLMIAAGYDRIEIMRGSALVGKGEKLKTFDMAAFNRKLDVFSRGEVPDDKGEAFYGEEGL